MNATKHNKRKLTSIHRRNEQLQLPAKHFGVTLSMFFRAYMGWRDHPGKLRIIGWLRSLFGSKRLVVSCRDGFLMAVDERDYVQRTIFQKGEWEPEVGELLLRELKKGDVFYDIGANVGYFTCLASTCEGVAVCSFEPDPISISVLKLNLTLNRVSSQSATAFQIAIGSQNERRKFSRFPIHNVGKSGFEIKEKAEEAFEVECRTLDSMISGENLPKPSVVKIDTEGWECHVLNGAKELFENDRPRLIIFEAVCDEECRISDPELIRFFYSRGYSISHLKRPSGLVEGNENFAAVAEQQG